MGNEKSTPIQYDMEEELIDITDNWIQKAGTINDGCTDISIFEKNINEKNLTNEFLHKFSKNLMIHRHPYILKYISSWYKSGKFYVVTEGAKPLNQVLGSQTPMQLCVGLYNILKVIIFLHEKALSSHNNICKDVVYVTTDGTWKLGRMEYLCRFSDLTNEYLASIIAHRYNPAINSEEDSIALKLPSNIDKYAFSVLVDEILEGKDNDDIPTVMEFKDYCKNRLRNNCQTDISLKQLIFHPFFTHRFVAIYTFLVELPLKTEIEKTEFFKTLADELTLFPEDLIAKQLTTLLLSRLVILNRTAQDDLLPRMLQLKNDKHPESLFTKEVAMKYVSLRLLDIFAIRDVHIRLILLKHFTNICSFFTHQQLRKYVLPELLVGIKDTNDSLVEATLNAVADLVPILGASTVVGKNRYKIFSDGCPLGYNPNNSSVNDSSRVVVTSSQKAGDNNISLIERPSPDGGEDIADNVNVDEDENDCWSDWENQTEVNESDVTSKSENGNIQIDLMNDDQKNITQSEIMTQSVSNNDLKLPPQEVKCSLLSNHFGNDEVDKLFKDMEPVISKAQVYTVINEETSKFQAKNTDYEALEGWEEDNINFEDNVTNVEANEATNPI